MNLYDDMNDLKNTVLEAKTRKKIFQQFQGVLHPRLEQKVDEDGTVHVGRGVGVMTRWHVEDVYGLITRDKDMLNQFGFLIQSVADDLSCIECEILIGKPVDGLDRSRKAIRRPIDVLLEQYETGMYNI